MVGVDGVVVVGQVGGLFAFSCINTLAIHVIGHFCLIHPKRIQRDEMSGLLIREAILAAHDEWPGRHIIHDRIVFARDFCVTESFWWPGSRRDRQWSNTCRGCYWCTANDQNLR